MKRATLQNLTFFIFIDVIAERGMFPCSSPSRIFDPMPASSPTLQKLPGTAAAVRFSSICQAHVAAGRYSCSSQNQQQLPGKVSSTRFIQQLEGQVAAARYIKKWKVQLQLPGKVPAASYSGQQRLEGIKEAAGFYSSYKVKKKLPYSVVPAWYSACCNINYQTHWQLQVHQQLPPSLVAAAR